MDKRFTFFGSLFCAVYLIVNGSYFLSLGEPVPASGSTRDLKVVYDLLPDSVQGLVDIFFGVLCLVVSLLSWVSIKNSKP